MTEYNAHPVRNAIRNLKRIKADKEDAVHQTTIQDDQVKLGGTRYQGSLDYYKSHIENYESKTGETKTAWTLTPKKYKNHTLLTIEPDFMKYVQDEGTHGQLTLHIAGLKGETLTINWPDGNFDKNFRYSILIYAYTAGANEQTTVRKSADFTRSKSGGTWTHIFECKQRKNCFLIFSCMKERMVRIKSFVLIVLSVILFVKAIITPEYSKSNEG